MKKKDPVIERQWSTLMARLREMLGKRPADIGAVLYLIGIQELGAGIKDFSKEEKQDLMHIAICKVLSYSGYYSLEGRDEEGWPHWKLMKDLPGFDLLEQETLIKTHIIEYFELEFQ